MIPCDLMPLKDQLKKILAGDIIDQEQALINFSKDASIFEIKPQLIIAPKDTTDIKNLIKFALSNKELNLSLTARSAGTDMSGGAINDSIILDMSKYFNHIIEMKDDYAVAEPGTYYKDFEREAAHHDLLLPCYPASKDICTIGGMVANNSAGEKTLSFGQTQDYVKKLKVVLSDGNEYSFEPLNNAQLNKKIVQKDFEGQVYKKMLKLIDQNYQIIQNSKPKVSKNSTGYLLWEVWDKKIFDLTKLFVGSQGTLGVLTKIMFKLVRPKKNSKLLVIFLSDLHDLGKIIQQVLYFHPESFESYDDQTLRFAVNFLPEIFRLMKSKNMLSLTLNFLPEIIMSLTGGFPKLVLLAEFTADTEEEVLKKCQDAQRKLNQFNLKTRITKDDTDTQKYWTIRRESFNLFRHHVKGKLHTAPFIDDFIVNPDFLPEFLPKLSTILAPYKNKLTYTIAGHIGNGNFHIIPLIDLSKKEHRKIIPELSQKVYDLVFEFHGSMSGEHNDGLVRGPYLKQMYGEKMYSIFKEVKEIFDPDRIFNPHKKIDATFEYSYQHISKN